MSEIRVGCRSTWNLPRIMRETSSMSSMMRRRAFLPSLAGLLALRPAAGTGQARLRVVGVLDGADAGPFFIELRKTLSGLGHIEGQNIRFEVRSGTNNVEALRRHADELARLNVDVIVTRLTPPLRAAMEATKTIPIVMSAAGGPVETGLVTGLARPGGNVTGMSLGGANFVGKRLQLIREMIPGVRHVLLVAAGANRYTDVIMAGTEQAGRELGIKVTSISVDPSARDLETRLAAIAEPIDAIHAMANVPVEPLVALAAKRRLPVFPTQRGAVDAGALLSYGGRLEEQYRGAALYVDRILKGAQPAELPVQEPARYELVINVKTARALGITIPVTLLAQADDLLE